MDLTALDDSPAEHARAKRLEVREPRDSAHASSNVERAVTCNESTANASKQRIMQFCRSKAVRVGRLPSL